MRKGTIATLLIINVILLIAGVTLIFVSLSGFFSAAANLSANGTPITSSMNGTTITLSNGTTSTQVALNPGMILGGITLVGVAALLHLISWIGTLVATARLSSWVWFVCVFLFQWIGILVYLIAGPSVARLSGPQPQYAPQYPPQYSPPPM